MIIAFIPLGQKNKLVFGVRFRTYIITRRQKTLLIELTGTYYFTLLYTTPKCKYIFINYRHL